MAKGILYTTASVREFFYTNIEKRKQKLFPFYQQLYTKSTTSDLDCAKAFIKKYGNFDDDDFPEPGTCSTINGSPDEEFSQ